MISPGTYWNLSSKGTSLLFGKRSDAIAYALLNIQPAGESWRIDRVTVSVVMDTSVGFAGDPPPPSAPFSTPPEFGAAEVESVSHVPVVRPGGP